MKNNQQIKFRKVLIGFAIGYFSGIIVISLDILFKGGSMAEVFTPLNHFIGPLFVGILGAIGGLYLHINKASQIQYFQDSIELSEKYKTMISNISDVIAILNSEGKIMYKSSNIKTHFGWQPHELIGKDAWETIHPDDLDKIKKAFYQILKKENMFAEVEYLYRCKDGIYKMVNLKAVNLVSNPHINGILANYHDITARNEVLKALKEEENKYRTLFDNMPDAVCMLGAEGEVQDINKAGADILGYPKEELLKKRIPDLVHPDDKERSKTYFKQLRDKGYYEYYEGRMFTKSGQIKWVQVSSVAIIKDGVMVGSQDIIRDMTDRKEMELTLKKSTEQLQELNATKDKFFSIIAHDLKSPFNNLLGLSNLLISNINRYSREETEKFVKLMHDSVENTYELLSNLLEWSVSQRGKMPFKPEEIKIESFLKDKIKILSGIAKQKDIELKVSIDNDFSFLADKNLLSTILRNLISNAIKFTHKGGAVDVRAFTNSTDIIFQVTDNGIGISEENQSRLFDLGQIESTVGTEQEKGTGLGLALCKEFVEKHGGKIWVESNIGVGSSFSFTIPVGFRQAI